MKLKYVINGDYGQLVSLETDLEKVNEQHNRIWAFIHTHRRFVLRCYYKEAANANPLPSRDYDDAMHENGYVLVTFMSVPENRVPYLAILQKELNIEIEDLPT